MKHVGAVVAEQQAVMALLSKRLWLTDQRSPDDAESFSRALFSHLVVVEQALIPAFRRADQATGMQATMRLVAAQLATAVAELQDSGSLCAYKDLKISIPMLFAAESMLVRGVPDEAVIDLDLALRLDDEFAALMGRSDLRDIGLGERPNAKDLP